MNYFLFMKTFRMQSTQSSPKKVHAGKKKSSEYYKNTKILMNICHSHKLSLVSYHTYLTLIHINIYPSILFNQIPLILLLLLKEDTLIITIQKKNLIQVILLYIVAINYYKNKFLLINYVLVSMI